MWTKAASFLNTVVEGVTDLVEKQKEAYRTESKRLDAVRRERERRERLSKLTVAPWVALSSEAEEREGDLKTQIIALSADERTVLVPTPESAHFEFDMVAALPYANGAVLIDKRLEALRRRLVPRRVKEVDFFQRYFYRVAKLRDAMGFQPLPLGDSEQMSKEACAQGQVPLTTMKAKENGAGASKAPSKDATPISSDPNIASGGETAGASPSAVARSDNESSENEDDEKAKGRRLFMSPKITGCAVGSDDPEFEEGVSDEFISDDFVNIGFRDAIEREAGMVKERGGNAGARDSELDLSGLSPTGGEAPSEEDEDELP